MKAFPSEQDPGVRQLLVKLPISASSFSLGITPASESLLALTMIMKRIAETPFPSILFPAIYRAFMIVE